MKADYDSEANAIGISIREVKRDTPAATTESVHARCNVAVVAGHPIDVELLYPDLGIDEPLDAAAARFDLDLEALKAAARSALEAPDRVVTVEVGVRQ